MVRVTDDELFDTNVHVRGIGNTALHIAAGRGDLAMVRILATAPDAIMNLRNNRGQIPLHSAAGNGHADVIWFLRILPDVDVNAVDAHGSTPLFTRLLPGWHAGWRLRKFNPRRQPACHPGNRRVKGSSTRKSCSIIAQVRHARVPAGRDQVHSDCGPVSRTIPKISSGLNSWI